MMRRGPLVHRSARWAGGLFVVGSAQFVVAMLAVQLLWPSTHVSNGPYSSYNPVSNYVSDFGNSTYTTLFWLFNGSIIVLGLLGMVGSLLLRRALASRTTARLGVAFLFIASLGAVLVGCFPETAPELNGNIHGLVSLLTFLGSGFALVFLALGMVRDTRWDGFRGFTGVLGLVTLVALAVYVPPSIQNGAYAGLVERFIVAPVLLWAIVAGIHLVRMPTYAPAVVRDRPSY